MFTKLFHKSAAKIIAAGLIVMLALAFLPASSALADSVTLTTSGNWTVPAGVTSVTIECWGGGGGGATVASGTSGGGGGGGGAYTKINAYAVTPGASIPYTIGAGGTAGNSGGTTTFNTTTPACVAAGGAGASGASGGNGGAAGTFAGGNGFTWVSGTNGGGGGGSAGTASAGNNATSSTGAVAVTGGGPGGNGATGNNNGSAPASGPGGGGGGAYHSSGGSKTGGAGYRGQIILTWVGVPTLTSPTATAITSSAATLGANITSDGGGTISQYGTCWAATANPTLLTGTCSAKGAAAVGVFTDPVTGLTTASRQVFYDGYATNETGTGYSTGGSFYLEPSAPATALSFTNVLSTSMTVNWANGTDSDGVIVLMKAGSAVNSDPVDGTWTGYTANATFGSGTQIGTGNYVVFKASGTSVNVIGLTSGTTYYVAVYAYKAAINTSGTAQGTNYLQTTPATGSNATSVTVPTVTSPTATSITSTTATLGANITSIGGATISQYGTCWALTQLPKVGVATCSTKGAGTTGVFTDPVTGLTAGSLIYYNGYATNTGGTGYSPDGSFYTEPSTQASGVNFTNNTSGTSITVNWTRGNGDGEIVLMKAGSAITGIPADGTYTTYSANTVFPTGTLITDAYVVFKAAGTSVTVTGLAPGTTYYVAVYEYKGAVNTSGVNQGTNYKSTPAAGNALTPTVPPTVTTLAATGLKKTSAVLHGTVNANNYPGGAVVTFNYTPCTSPTPAPTTYLYTVTAAESPVSGAITTAVSAEIPGGLTPATTYCFRVVATSGALVVADPNPLAFVTLAAGTPKTYYVDKTNGACSDAGSGTISAPFCTIAQGASLADAGDTVYVLHGSYAETVKPSYNGGPGLLLTIKADPGVIVTGNGNTTSGGAFRLFSKGYIVIDGFTITGTADDGISVTSSQYITISHNHVSTSGTTAIPKRGMNLSYTTYSIINANTTDHNTNDGILLRNSSNNNTISNNISFANAEVTASEAAGISLLGSINNTIKNNIVYGNEDSGMNFYSTSTNNIVVNNLSFGNGDHGFDNNASPSNQYISNTVYGNGTSGINFEASSGGATLYNNISIDNGYRRLTGGGTYNTISNPGNLRFDDTSVTGNTLDYDIVYSSTTDNIMWDSAIYGTMAEFHGAYPTQETHGLDANPSVTAVFVGPTTVATRSAGSAPYTVTYNPIYDATHPTGDNYHLAATSIAIDSANSNTPNEQATDIEGNSRVDIPTVADTGAGVRTYDDRGAYEYQLPGNQTIIFTSTAPTNAVVSGPTYTPTATGGASGNPVVFTIDATASSICSINLGVVSFTAVGTCVIDANQAGGNGYNPAPQVQQSFVVGMGSQIITFTSTAPANAAVAGPTYIPTATGGGSGNPVVFTIDASATSVCSINLGVVSFTAVGTCTIDANQLGNANYNAAQQVQQSFAVGLGSQTITFTSTAPATAVVAGPTYTPTATGGASGNPVTFTIDATSSTICSIGAGNAVSFSAVGTCKINANQAGSTNYNPAPQVQQSFAVGKGSQTITFTSTAPANAVAGGPTYTPTATGGASGNPVTFTIDATATAICSINSGVVSFTAVGTCKVDANQAGDANYNAATQVQQSFTVGKGNQVISVTTPAPVSAALSTSFTVAATASSGLPVEYSATGGVCTNVGATFTMLLSSGTCVVHFNQPGNVNYNAAPEIIQNVVARGSAQTIIVDTHAPASAIFNTSFTVAAHADSLLPVAYSATGACTNVGPVFTMTKAFGTCIVHYNQAGDSNYAAAPEITEGVVAQGNVLYLPLVKR
jgi:parallel beta-helix repeat protein